MGHNWQEATCQTAKLCLTCLLTEGETAAHTDENSDGECDLCGETLSDTTPEEDNQEQPGEDAPQETPEDNVSGEPEKPQDSTPKDEGVSDVEKTSSEDGNLLVIVICIAGAILVAAVIIVVIILRKKRSAS